MKPAIQIIEGDRRSRLGLRGSEYLLCTHILGTTVELRATHIETGERFIARALQFDLAMRELDRLVQTYGPGSVGAFPVRDLVRRTATAAWKSVRRAGESAYCRILLSIYAAAHSVSAHFH